MRVWRNWQTRKIQVLMLVTMCRFKSCHPHQNRDFSVSVFFFTSHSFCSGADFHLSAPPSQSASPSARKYTLSLRSFTRSLAPYFLRALPRKPSPGRFPPRLPVTRTKTEIFQSLFFLCTTRFVRVWTFTCLLLPRSQLPRRLGNISEI